MLQQDQTATTTIVAAGQIQALPITFISDVITLNSSTSGSGGNLHLRGGGAGELGYLVEGLSFIDPNGGPSGMSLGRSALQEMQIASGIFNAEFGNAQSGLVLIDTPEGATDRYSGRLSYQTDHTGDEGLGETMAQLDWYEGSLGGPEPLTKYLLPLLGVNLPGAMTIFLQGETRMFDRADFHVQALADLNRKSLIRESPELHSSEALRQETIFGKFFSLGGKRETVLSNYNTKLVWQMTPSSRFTLSWRGQDHNIHQWNFTLGREVGELVAAAQDAGISNLVNEDGDNFVDEELLDGRDNDGDGAIDEDTRLDQSYYLGDFAWGLDNDRDGRVDEEALNNIDDDRDGQIDEDLQPYDWRGNDRGARYEQRGDQLNFCWMQMLNPKNFFEIRLGRSHASSGSLPKLGKNGRSRSSFDELENWIREFDALIAGGVAIPDLPFMIEPYRGFGTPAERFTDRNGNRCYDLGEPFEDWDGDGLYDLNNAPGFSVNLNQPWLLQGATHPFRGQYIHGSHWLPGRAGFDKRTATNYAFRFDFTSQIFSQHELKGGLEANYSEVADVARQFLAPYDGLGLFRFQARSFTNREAVYVQDKTTFANLVVNLGVRAGRFDPGNQNVPQSDTSANFQPPGARWQIMPRLSLAFAATGSDVIFAGAGRFVQSLSGPVRSGNAIAYDSDVHPAQTTQFELGGRHGFGRNTVVSLRGFAKKTTNAPRMQQVFDGAGNAFLTYFNDSDFQIKGLELQWTFKTSLNFSADVSYTLQEGQFVYLPRNTDIITDISAIAPPVDWDQRHKLVFIGAFDLGEKEGLRLGSIHPFEELSASAVVRWASGLPYTPSTLSGAPLIEQTNTRRFPQTFEIDVRLRRFFKVGEIWRLGAVFEVRNLTNRRNALGMDDGGIIDTHRDKIGFTNTGTARARNYGGFSNAAPHPAAWRHGRIVQMGITAEF
ncbi:MAG: hypothetical protein ACREOO_19945 [bacterium]